MPQKNELMVFFKLWHFPKQIQLFLPDFDLGSYLGISGTPPENGLQGIQMCPQLLELTVKSPCLHFAFHPLSSHSVVSTKWWNFINSLYEMLKLSILWTRFVSNCSSCKVGALKIYVE